MASSRRRSVSRRAEDERARRRERLIIGGVVGALALAAVMLGAAFYVGQYREPRAHVLTIGDEDFTAEEFFHRARLTMLTTFVTEPSRAIELTYDQLAREVQEPAPEAERESAVREDRHHPCVHRRRFGDRVGIHSGHAA